MFATGAAAAAATALPVTAPFVSVVSGAPKNTLTIAHAIDALTLDPHQTGMRESRIVTQQVFDYLLTATAEKYYPGLATQWEASPDGKAWTFTLVSGARFHDGTPVDAEAVRLNFERVVKLGPKALALVNLATNYDKAEVLSSTRLRVFLKRPYAGFLNMVGEYLAIVSPSAAEKLGDTFGRSPVGSGPFIFRSWTPNDRIVIARNPAYRWGARFLGNTGPARMEQVEYRVIPEASTLTGAFQQGEAQMLDFVAPSDISRLKSVGTNFDLQIQVTPGMVSCYHFNMRKEPTDDVRVRQAIAYSINKQELAKSPSFGSDLVPVVYSYLSRSNWAYDPKLEAAHTYAFNPGRAQSLLDEAGWRSGSGGVRSKGGKSLTLTLLSLAPLPISVGTDLIVQSQLSKVGIAAEIQKTDIAGYYAALSRENFNMALNSAAGFDPDSPLVRSYSSKGGSNWAHYQNPKVDDLLEKAAVEVNAERRRAIYGEVQRALLNDLPALPMDPFTGLVVKQKSLVGVYFDPRIQYKLLGASFS